MRWGWGGVGEGKPLGSPEQGRENTVVPGSAGSDEAVSSRPGHPMPSQASPTPSQSMKGDLKAQADLGKRIKRTIWRPIAGRLPENSQNPVVSDL